MNPFVGAAATILAAFIAGSITYLVSVFTKEGKVSDFRQNWIDGLREDTAKFIGIWYYVAADVDLLTEEEVTSREFWRGAKDEFIQMEVLQAKIELRLNPKEHSEAIEQLRFLATGESIAGLSHLQRVEEIRSFSDKIQKILKSEWTRVKQGEATYRYIKHASRVLILVASLSLMVAVVIHAFSSAAAP